MRNANGVLLGGQQRQFHFYFFNNFIRTSWCTHEKLISEHELLFRWRRLNLEDVNIPAAWQRSTTPCWYSSCSEAITSKDEQRPRHHILLEGYFHRFILGFPSIPCWGSMPLRARMHGSHSLQGASRFIRLWLYALMPVAALHFCPLHSSWAGR